MNAPDARAVEIAFAAFRRALGAVAGEKADADVGVGRMGLPQPLHGRIVEARKVLIVFDGVLDAHRPAAIDVFDKVLHEFRDPLVVADRVDDRDAPGRREIVRRRSDPREREMRA